ncbi:MAG: UDP-N-acetylglucosamine 1-carboxyvinyltransferase [Alphaproteobacteria bacterium]
MDRMIIQGTKTPLRGHVAISGSKNAALPIMAASLLSEDPLNLHNVPDLNDTRVMVDLLRDLGAQVVVTEPQEGALALSLKSPQAALNPESPLESARKMRASVIVLGPLLAHMGRATVPLPGGCPIGARPLDVHEDVLVALGATITYHNHAIHAHCDGGLKGATHRLRVPSVGATENGMMAAVLAKGTSVFHNVAREPEIVDLAHCLNAMGADIQGAGTDTMTIHGVTRLHGATHTIIPDRIEAMTYLIAAALTRGDVTLTGANKDHIQGEINCLRAMGFDVQDVNATTLRLNAAGAQPKPACLTTAPYPGLPTDIQAQMMVLMTSIAGESRITETIFENRFQHVAPLKAMGAHITQQGETCTIHGGFPLRGADVEATDLRASSSLVLAGLVAEGTTTVGGLHHLYRGYVHLPEKLRACGATVTRLQDPSWTRAGAAS